MILALRLLLCENCEKIQRIKGNNYNYTLCVEWAYYHYLRCYLFTLFRIDLLPASWLLDILSIQQLAKPYKKVITNEWKWNRMSLRGVEAWNKLFFWKMSNYLYYLSYTHNNERENEKKLLNNLTTINFHIHFTPSKTKTGYKWATKDNCLT